MKINLSTRRNHASVLLISLIILLVAAVIFLAFSGLIRQESDLTSRSQAWNQALPVSEAGIEEAFAFINTGVGAKATNGWTLSSDQTTVTKSNSIDNTTFYSASIVFNNATPLQITSVGSVRYGQAILTRTVRVQTKQASTGLFQYGLAVARTITLAGGSRIDSYNSTNGNYSTSTARDQATIASGSTSAKAIDLQPTTFVNGYARTGTGGDVYYGWYGPNVWNYNGNSRLGDSAYVAAGGNPGVQTNHVFHDFVFNYANVTYTTNATSGITINTNLPSGGSPATYSDLSSSALPTTGINGGRFFVSDGNNLAAKMYYTFSSMNINGGGYWYNSPSSGCVRYLVTNTCINVVKGAFNVSSDGTMVIGANANYTLYALGGFNLSGNGGLTTPTLRIDSGARVTIYAPAGFNIGGSCNISVATNASLNIYAGGTVDIGGAGMLGSASSASILLYGLTNCTSVTLEGSGSILGGVYAPQANLIVTGGSPFFGAAIAKSAAFTGSGNFHFDENLKNVGLSTGGSYTYASWTEL